MKKFIRLFPLLLVAFKPAMVQAQAPYQKSTVSYTQARAAAAREAEQRAFELAVENYYRQKDALAEGGAAGAVRARPAGVREITVQIQIFLDQMNFGPGVIDGRPGEFTRKALARYQRANGLPESGRLEDALSQLPLDKVQPMYTAHVITEEDVRRVGSVPNKPIEQAKLKRMPYSSLSKFLEERYHCSPGLIQGLNPSLNISQLQAGDTVYVPAVQPFRIEEVKATGKMPTIDEYKERRKIEIDTHEKFLELYEDDKLIAAFPITPGSSNHPAPAGKWRIVGIATLPWFRWDEGVLKRGVRTGTFYNIPAGPTSPVGVVWMGLNKPGIGLHGTNNPQTIGRAGSHGCIRLANWDAIRLANMVSAGTPVTIDAQAAGATVGR